MSKFYEAYRRIGDPDDRFDVEFWQEQGPQAIFEAMRDLIIDAMIIRGEYADEPRLDRTVESFHRPSGPVPRGRRVRGHADLNRAKEASGRPQDLTDVENMKKIKRRKRRSKDA